MADGIAITAGSGTTIATDDCGAAGHAQITKQAISTDGSATLIPADANGLSVQGAAADGAAVAGRPVLVAGQDGTNAQSILTDTSGRLQNVGAAAAGAAIAGNPVLVGGSDGTNARALATDTAGNIMNVGTIAHDGIDSGNPIKVGMRALAHGTNPTAVAAADRTDWLANRAGVPWVIGGHPNVVTIKHTTITTAVTDAAIVTVGAGAKIVVTRITVTLDNASTVFPTLLIGFGTANTPTTTGVLAAHGGVPAGGGMNIGDGSGILGIGADNEDLRVTTTGNATGNGLQIVVSYYTIES